MLNSKMLMMHSPNNSTKVGLRQIVIHIVSTINNGVHLHSSVTLTNTTMGLEVGTTESVLRDFRLANELCAEGTTVPTWTTGRTTIYVRKDKGCLMPPNFP